MLALKGVDFDVRAGRGALPARSERRRQVDADQVRLGRGRADRGRDPASTASCCPSASRRSRWRAGSATIYQELDLVEDLTRRRERSSSATSRAGSACSTARAMRARDDRAARAPRPRRHPARHARRARCGPAAQQIVSIARALSRDVQLLIMDEPSAILDDGEIETLFDVVRRLTAEGVGVDLHLAPPRRDPPHRRPRHGALRRPHGGDRPARPTRRAASWWRRWSAARSSSSTRTRAARASDEVVLDVRDVSRPAARERVQLPGPRGRGRRHRRAGRRRALGAAAADLRPRPPDAGEVSLDGKRLPPDRPDVAIAPRHGPRARGPQVAGPAARLEPGQERQPRRPRPLHHRPAGSACAPSARRPATQLRELNTVPDDPDRIARELSGGNQQKVVLARWLLRECRVLLLDEPTRGVDVGAKAEIYRLIAELAATGSAVVVVSSELEELVGLCTRILVMREGEIVAEVDGETSDRGRAAEPRRRADGHRRRPGGDTMTTAPAAPPAKQNADAGAGQRARSTTRSTRSSASSSCC